MDSMDSESRLSDLDESSLSNPPPSDSESSDSSESDNEVGRKQGRGGGGGVEENNGSDDDDDDDDDDSDNSDDDEGQDQTTEEQIEWLATTRARRSNAGNRMKSMMLNEEPADSDLEHFFAEDENDVMFLDTEENASDVQMDSSSEDEGDADDTNAAGGDDDLAGEKELEKQAREKRAAQRKRKAQAAIPAKFRKRVRIDATASGTSTPAAAPRPKPPFAPRPRKKSERLSWLPSPADLPTRASSRETTRISKEQLHQQMVEREEKRHKQMIQMQKKAARMEALKKPPMTQEDRLREAAIVETRNSKSLNRWEVAEKQREEERRAKLAALHQRTLKGPVITNWSGIGEARRAVVEEEKPKRKREKADRARSKPTDMKKTEPEKEALGGIAGQEDVDVKPSTDSAPLKPPHIGLTSPMPEPRPLATSTNTTIGVKELKLPIRQDSTETNQHGESTVIPVDGDSRPRLMAMPPGPSSSAPNLGPLSAPNRTGFAHPHDRSGKPSGVLAAPVLAAPVLALPPDMNLNFDTNQPPKSNVLAPPNTSQLVSGQALPPIPIPSQDAVSKPPTTTARFLPPEPENEAREDVKSEAAQESREAGLQGSEPATQLATETSADTATTTRNTIIFQNFDENAIKDTSIQTEVLFGQKMNKLPKPLPVSICAITNLPARYRDPKTGLAYYNTFAYRQIQRLSRGEHRWSKILNAWVGSGTVAARGVPERFLNPDAPRRTAKGEEKAKTAAAGQVKEEEASKQAKEGQMTQAASQEQAKQGGKDSQKTIREASGS